MDVSENTDSITRQLSGFGLSIDEIRIYLQLRKKGISSVLAISRAISIPRTRVYRNLDGLIERGLVNTVVGEHGALFEGVDPEHLDELIRKQELELESVKESVPSLIVSIQELSKVNPASSKTLSYLGEEGLKQITWNSLKAKNELLIFEIESMATFLNYGYSEKVRREFVDRKVKVRELTNCIELDGWTDVTEFATKHWQCRYIDPAILKMDVEILIYNDVYAAYSYRDRGLYGVEIYNQMMADMQKQVFNFMWEHAKPMRLVNDHGAAKVAT
jgi:sugar-specific transcriptional regulator TrmB